MHLHIVCDCEQKIFFRATLTSVATIIMVTQVARVGGCLRHKYFVVPCVSCAMVAQHVKGEKNCVGCVCVDRSPCTLCTLQKFVYRNTCAAADQQQSSAATLVAMAIFLSFHERRNSRSQQKKIFFFRRHCSAVLLL